MPPNPPAPAGHLNDMNPSQYQYPQGGIFISSRLTDDFGVIRRPVSIPQLIVRLQIGVETPRVYIDTNVLKFSASALRRLVSRTQTINWAGHIQDVVVHDIKIINPNDGISNERLRTEVDLLPCIAELGKLHRLRFQMQWETRLESWGLRNMDSQTGLFYGAEIETIDAPIQYSRVMVSAGMDADRLQYDFLARQEHPRFKELQKATGAYQGLKPLNRNQLLDAFHFWCAEHNSCDYFLTLDFTLVHMLSTAHQRRPSTTIAVTASELLGKIAT